MPAGFTRNLQAPHRPYPRAAICCKHGVLSWGFVGLDPLKYVGGVRVCFDPLKRHVLSFETVVG